MTSNSARLSFGFFRDRIVVSNTGAATLPLYFENHWVCDEDDCEPASCDAAIDPGEQVDLIDLIRQAFKATKDDTDPHWQEHVDGLLTTP